MGGSGCSWPAYCQYRFCFLFLPSPQTSSSSDFLISGVRTSFSCSPYTQLPSSSPFLSPTAQLQLVILSCGSDFFYPLPFLSSVSCPFPMISILEQTLSTPGPVFFTPARLSHPLTPLPSTSLRTRIQDQSPPSLPAS